MVYELTQSSIVICRINTLVLSPPLEVVHVAAAKSVITSQTPLY